MQSDINEKTKQDEIEYVDAMLNVRKRAVGEQFFVLWSAMQADLIFNFSSKCLIFGHEGQLRQRTIAPAGHQLIALAEIACEGVLSHHTLHIALEGVVVFINDHSVVGSVFQP